MLTPHALTPSVFGQRPNMVSALQVPGLENLGEKLKGLTLPPNKSSREAEEMNPRTSPPDLTGSLNPVWLGVPINAGGHNRLFKNQLDGFSLVNWWRILPNNQVLFAIVAVTHKGSMYWEGAERAVAAGSMGVHDLLSWKYGEKPGRKQCAKHWNEKDFRKYVSLTLTPQDRKAQLLEVLYGIRT